MRPNPWLLLVACIGGCSGISVDRDYDPNHDFSTLKTWSRAPEPPQADGGGAASAGVSGLTHERIQRAITRELSRKQFQETAPDDADFWVQHHAAVGQRIESSPGYDYHWYGDDLAVYDEGTIVVDVMTPKDKRLIWRGTARAAVDPDLSPEEREARIREAVEKILELFPPQK